MTRPRRLTAGRRAQSGVDRLANDEKEKGNGARMQDLKLFSGNANVALARSVAAYLDIELGRAEVGTFSDGECAIEISENVRGLDCFALQSTCAPQNSNLMELLIMIDALKRASARRITAVMPYYGYARQDRKVRPRVPITAKLVADLIQTAGADRLRVRAQPRPGRTANCTT